MLAKNSFLLWTMLLALVCGAWLPQGTIRIYLIGDSTMADKPPVDNPERGWGQVLRWFCDSSIVVENHARNGRSTKSFIAEGRWQAIADALRPGDHVFIQFGHNDSKVTDSTRYAEPWSTYRKSLERFVSESRQKGAVPILITPVNRRSFDSAGTFVDKHSDYPHVVREVARNENVGLIDLHAKSRHLFEQLGPRATQRLFLWVPPGRYRSIPLGKQDNTHFTKEGALVVAGLVVQGIRELNLPIAEHLAPISPGSLVGLNKIVGLDYYFNCEWREVGKGSKVRYHYVWEDTTNSGFSELGRVIDQLGANIATVPEVPTAETLKPLSLYVIVDPDTPQETKDPHYIDDAAARSIESWVQSGGTLVLMGNDKGNAEFEHLNQLAERFGIRFNEDSHHRVVGRDFDAGKCDRLPEHPIFRGVRQIYLKELSSLKLAKTAVPVLTQGDLVLMAVARVGKGTVFAVGDPWLYNEYFDHRKLPQSYDNDKAGRNLFRWLLDSSPSELLRGQEADIGY